MLEIHVFVPSLQELLRAQPVHLGMNRFVSIGLVGFVTLAFAATAIAAETILYAPAQGTVTKYTGSVVNSGKIVSFEITASDGSKVPESLSSTFSQALESGLNLKVQSSTTETVTEVRADGTRVVQTDATSGTSAIAGVNTPPQKWVQTVAFKPDGQIEVLDVKFDIQNADPQLAKTLDQTAQNLKNSIPAQYTGLYNTPFEIGQALQTTTRSNPAVILGASGADVESVTTRTLRSKGDQGQYVFDVASDTPAFQFEQTLPNQPKPFKYAFDAFKTAGTESYLSDGRLERTTIQTSGRIQFELTIALGDGLEYLVKAATDLQIQTTREIAAP